jgi:hypothetical protein
MTPGSGETTLTFSTIVFRFCVLKPSRLRLTVVMTLGRRSVDSTWVLKLKLIRLWYRLNELIADRSLASTTRTRTCFFKVVDEDGFLRDDDFVLGGAQREGVL